MVLFVNTELALTFILEASPSTARGVLGFG
jgi:hypothetical protein